MQIIIDIPDEKDFKDKALWNDVFDFDKEDLAIILKAIANGTPIPDNDCNSCEKAWTDKCERAECYENNYKHWTPYQKGGKE